ncbi:hypothetical protein Tco_0392734 [Tanacetum coccineum]
MVNDPRGGPHASSVCMRSLGQIPRGSSLVELPLHTILGAKLLPEWKAEGQWKCETQFDLRPHMESDRWPQIYAGIQQHLQKIYNGKKAALKERYWVPEEDGTYDLERLRRGRPSYISEVNWDAQLAFWNDPKNLARAAQNKQNRAKSKVMETSATREYPSLIHTFFLTHTVGGEAGGRSHLHITHLGVGAGFAGQGTVIPPPSQSTHSADIARQLKRRVGCSGSGGCGDDKPGDDEDGGENEDDS